MASLVLAKAKTKLQRSLGGLHLGRRSLSSLVDLDHGTDQLIQDSVRDNNKVNVPCWVPHPRTGIYYPKGNEWVMDGVPSGAASFDRTHWLRSVEDVEKPLPDG